MLPIPTLPEIAPMLWAVSLAHPGLLAVGGALVAVPVVIHWLRQRRVRTVEWAAMEFLRGAHRRERRRLKWEEALLLAARCVAVLLVALVVARPSGESQRGDSDAASDQWVVIDDSRSMQAQTGGATSWDLVRRRLVEWCEERAEAGRGDTLTLVRASAPQAPLVVGVPLATSRVDEIASLIDRLEPTDTATNLVAALDDVQAAIAATPARLPRRVTVWSDLRAVDWNANDKRPADTRAADARSDDDDLSLRLRRLVEAGSQCVVVDVGGERTENVQIAELSLEPFVAAGVPVRCEVVLKNRGAAAVGDLQLRLSLGDSPPTIVDLDPIPPQGQSIVPVTAMFGFVPTKGEERLRPTWESVRAEVVSNSSRQGDALAADDRMEIVARVWPAAPVLLVDGAPSSSASSSAAADVSSGETFYLARALGPRGELPSGIEPTVVKLEQLATRSLSDYSVVCLCNPFRLSQRDMESLQRWVGDGGSLVIWPGDQTDRDWFNRNLHQDGRGLAPLALGEQQGDPTNRQWLGFQPTSDGAGIARVFAGADNPWAGRIKVFRWWKATVESPSTQVLMRLTDSASSPALAAAEYGRGRVIMLTVPADADWTNWPEEPSYLVFVQELIADLMRRPDEQLVAPTGRPLQSLLDIRRFEPTAILRRPGDRTETLTAVSRTGDEAAPAARGDGATNGGLRRSATSDWRIESQPLDIAGRYELELTRTDGGRESRAMAAVAPEREGDLTRIEPALAARTLNTIGVTYVRDDGDEWSKSATGGEDWSRGLAAGLVALLVGESLLAWRFGRRRQ